MSIAEKIRKKYTYNDYVKWPDEERWEFIDGGPYNMTPAPNIKHQNVVGVFYSLLKQKLLKPLWEVFELGKIDKESKPVIKQ